jgi:hypothetical protein
MRLWANKGQNICFWSSMILGLSIMCTLYVLV